MNNPLQALLDESEKAIALQKEIINNQELQITKLNEINESLKTENQQLKQMYSAINVIVI